MNKTQKKSSMDRYKARVEKFTKLKDKQQKFLKLIATFRLIVFLLTFVVGIYLYRIKLYYMSLATFVALFIVFVYAVYVHSKVKYKKKYLESMIHINEEAMKRFNGEWKGFQDNGEEYIDDKHQYINDLDIFGKASLFQYINTTTTNVGRNRLSELLKNSPKNKSEILLRQDAIQELSKKISFRQRFNVFGLIKGEKIHSAAELFSWAENEEKKYTSLGFKIAIYFASFVMILSILLCLFTNVVSYRVPLLLVVIQLIILSIKNVDRNNRLNLVYKYKKDIKQYADMLRLIENQKWKSQMLIALNKKLYNEKTKNASYALKKLDGITDLISDRNNAANFVFNILFLWDYQCLIKLEMWKKQYGKYLKDYIYVVGEVEALSSLSIIGFDNPEWVRPKFQEKLQCLYAREMAHPLINKPVANDVNLDIANSIMLITGSNMAGKSTLLRTSGINLVLAYAGAVVCAKEFSCSLMEIFTCMRISDRIEDNISSFYAEILRIKLLVNGAKDRKVFFLLDEIFRGTNSMDRHAGAEALIKSLSKEMAIGFISTHDLELGELEDMNSKVRNYHFEEYYHEDKLMFDYKLRKGVSTTRNARYLMKLAGIEI